MKICEGSCLLQFKNICTDWESRLQHQRRKIPQKEMEEKAEVAAMLFRLCEVASEKTKLSKDIIEKNLHQEFIENNLQLMAELQTALQELGLSIWVVLHTLQRCFVQC